jgi:hypothetical protein
MMVDDEHDETLAARFASLRARDAREAPAFAPMFARATQIASAGEMGTPAVPSRVAPHRRSRWTVLWAAGPLLTASGLGAVWLNARQRAEREFDQTVTAWTRASESTRRSSTDALLALPGDEYLKTVPSVGRDAGTARRPL